ncbi:MAG: type II toxin-antitoxin system RelE/ParE family toxin [Terriglobia bacterium]
MAWEVEFTDEFEQWWHALSEPEQGKVDARVSLLMEHGPNLGFPFSSQVKSSRFPQMRELRAQAGGDPLRILYAFDPRRTAILLVAGDKTGDGRWYETNVPVADRLFERHLKTIEKGEG